MILVDTDIKKKILNNQLIVSGYNESNVNCASYDLTLYAVIADDIEHDLENGGYLLKSGELIIVKCNEELLIPQNIVGVIKEKNSVLRLGLFVSGPFFHPGHRTYCYLRIYNLSKSSICLNKNFKIAQIVFEELTQTPSITYDKNALASFNEEKIYVKYGKYKNQYDKITKNNV